MECRTKSREYGSQKEEQKMRNIRAILLAAIFAIPGCDCGNSTPPKSPKIDIYRNVDRVFMHEPGQYTFLVSDDTKRLWLITPRTTSGYFLIFADVSANEPMWAKVTYDETKDFYEGRTEVEIHIHSAKEIDGAGWDFGKQGKGQTVPVE